MKVSDGTHKAPRIGPALALDWAGYEELNRRAFVAYHGDNPARLRRSMIAQGQDRDEQGRFVA